MGLLLRVLAYLKGMELLMTDNERFYQWMRQNHPEIQKILGGNVYKLKFSSKTIQLTIHLGETSSEIKVADLLLAQDHLKQYAVDTYPEFSLLPVLVTSTKAYNLTTESSSTPHWKK